MSDTNSDNNNSIEPIENRVAQSGIITIDLADYLPKQEILEVDLKDFLFQGLLLKETEFKNQVRDFDFNRYENQIVALFCSTDALIQQWAYMYLVSRFPQSARVYFGQKNEVIQQVMSETIRKLPIEEFENQRVIVRGCGDLPISDQAYVEITKRISPVVQSLMYGEICSNVPIIKKKKSND